MTKYWIDFNAKTKEAWIVTRDSNGKLKEFHKQDDTYTERNIGDEDWRPKATHIEIPYFLAKDILKLWNFST